MEQRESIEIIFCQKLNPSKCVHFFIFLIFPSLPQLESYNVTPALTLKPINATAQLYSACTLSARMQI